MTREEQNQRHEAMREYKAQGHSMQEVADYFCVSNQTAQRTCKGISPQTYRRPKQYKNGWDGERKEANAIRIINERASMFEYVGGFTNVDGYADIRCKACGSVLHKSFVSIRKGKARCEICYRLSLEKKHEQRKKIEADKKAWAKCGKGKAKQLSMSVCKQCGSLFFDINRTSYCSNDCMKKACNSNGSDKRLKRIGEHLVDKDISLDVLYKRDGGVCYLCGYQCRYDDYVIRDGYKICGDLYPSVDHVIPISKGGEHSWVNVRLAHRKCNTVKRDNAPSPKF